MQEKLIILRMRNGLTQKELADLLNISEKQYGFKERGKSEFLMSEMFTISNYFKLSIENIFLPLPHQYKIKKEVEQ